MPNITPTEGYISSHKMWSLPPTLSVRDIEAKLPGIEDKGRSGDDKCLHTWDFLADGQPCAIWDYKGSRWSAFGPRKVFEDLGWLTLGS